jgi:hypothetical protein
METQTMTKKKAEAKVEEVVAEQVQAQAQAQAPKNLTVLMLDEATLNLVINQLLEIPAKDVFSTLVELQNQINSQKEIVEFIKSAEVQEAAGLSILFTTTIGL